MRKQRGDERGKNGGSSPADDAQGGPTSPRLCGVPTAANGEPCRREVTPGQPTCAKHRPTQPVDPLDVVKARCIAIMGQEWWDGMVVDIVTHGHCHFIIEFDLHPNALDNEWKRDDLTLLNQAFRRDWERYKEEHPKTLPVVDSHFALRPGADPSADSTPLPQPGRPYPEGLPPNCVWIESEQVWRAPNGDDYEEFNDDDQSQA